jgi:hypothetical protein
MKTILSALMVASSVLASPDFDQAGHTGGAVKLDVAVVARVNGEPVTRAEFERMVGNPLTREQLQQELGVKDPDVKDLERLALRQLIHHRLMLQEATRRQITVTNEELDEGMAALRRRFDDL